MKVYLRIFLEDVKVVSRIFLKDVKIYIPEFF
jgi:hypothetical protein